MLFPKMSLAVCGMGRFMLHKRLWCLVRWRWSPNVLFVIRPMVRSPYQLNSWHWRLWPLGTGVSYVSYMVVHGGGGVFHVCGTCVVVVVVVQGGQWWPDVLVTPVASGDLCPRQQEARHCSHPPPTRGRKTSRGRKSSNNFDVTSTFQHDGTENLLI